MYKLEKFKVKMHACIVVKNKSKVDIEDFQETLQSLKSQGFETCNVKEYPNVEADVWLFNGEKITKPLKNCNSIVQFNEVFREEERGRSSYLISSSKNTPIPKFVLSLADNEMNATKKFLIDYPKCLESHYKYAMLCMQNHDYKTAFEHFETGRKWLNKPLKSEGWVNSWHQYNFDFESSICAYYAQEHDKGQWYTDRVIVNKNVPQSLLSRTYQNYEFFIKSLQVLWTKEYFVQDMEEIPSILEGYKSLNPSLIPHPNGTFYLNLRIVNWSVNPVGFNQYTSSHPKNKFKTKNILGIINEEGNYVQKPQLVSKIIPFIGKVRSHHIDGFEDCRLFASSQEEDTLHFITNCTKNNPKGDMRLSVGTIALSKDSSPKYTSLIPITGYGDDITQKNWLLYDKEGTKAQAIYGYNPFTIIEIDLETGIATPISQAHFPIRSGEFRGSAGPVPFEDGYLLVIHQVYYKAHGGRRYLHRFIKLDSAFLPTKISMAWYLQSDNIEYVSTMQALSSGKILIGYGLCDKCACITCVETKTISEMLRPITDYL